MPIILDKREFGARNYLDSTRLEDANYNYSYPRGMKLKPGTELHKNLKDAVLQRSRMSQSEMSKRYDSWQKIDETLTAYIPLSTAEEALEEADRRKPLSIVVPLSYATMETLLTYVVAAFLDPPIFKYEGTGSEDVFGAMLLERVVDIQARRAKMGVALHTFFRDAFAYGFGAISPAWEQRYGFRSTKEERGFMSTLGGFLRTGFDKKRERVLRFEGNVLDNIDPYCYLPDVSVPIHEPQRGEHCGWLSRENRMEILSRERDSKGMFFNGEYIRHIKGTSVLGTDESARDRDQVRADEGMQSMSQPVDVIYQYLNIVPDEWGIGNSKYPEKWMVALAGDQVIIAAGPTDADHDMFPVAICAPDYDGYSATPISRLEVVYGLQTFVNFLYNSHIANIRKAINDMFVADPEMINLNDLLHPSPGKVIRLRKKAWGRGVQNAVEQLKVQDITRENVAEALSVMGYADQVTGATDSIKGILRRGGERMSAEEFRGTRGSALSRLEKAARIAGLQGIQDLGYMVGYNTQQYMSKDQYVKAVGRYEEELREQYGDEDRVLVGPMDLLVDYDVDVGDGTLPTSGDPQLWATIFQVIGSSEILAPQFNIVNVFKHLARLMGAKNIGEFVNKQPVGAEVRQDEDVMREAEKGNLLPIGDLSEVL